MLDNYRLLANVDELKKFYDMLYPLEPGQVYHVGLSARNKYLSEEKKIEFKIRSGEMLGRELVRENNFNMFLKKITSFERRKEGSYFTKNDFNIPEECLVIYSNLNPSNCMEASGEFAKELVGKVFDKNTDPSYYSRVDLRLMSFIQKIPAERYWIDIDIDLPFVKEGFKEYLYVPRNMAKALNENNVEYKVVSTKGGYHILIKKSTLPKGFNLKAFCNTYDKLAKEVYKTSEKNSEVKINDNRMIPTPGTFQSGHLVRFLEEEELI